MDSRLMQNDRNALWAAYWALQALPTLTPTLRLAADELSHWIDRLDEPSPPSPQKTIAETSRGHLRLVSDDDLTGSGSEPPNRRDDLSWEWHCDLDRDQKDQIVLEVLADQTLTNKEIEAAWKHFGGPRPRRIQGVAAWVRAMHQRGRVAREEERLLDGSVKFRYCRPDLSSRLAPELREMEKSLGQGEAS